MFKALLGLLGGFFLAKSVSARRDASSSAVSPRFDDDPNLVDQVVDNPDEIDPDHIQDDALYDQSHGENVYGYADDLNAEREPYDQSADDSSYVEGAEEHDMDAALYREETYSTPVVEEPEEEFRRGFYGETEDSDLLGDDDSSFGGGDMFGADSGDEDDSW